jgi:hypothetical protein
MVMHHLQNETIIVTDLQVCDQHKKEVTISQIDNYAFQRVKKFFKYLGVPIIKNSEIKAEKREITAGNVRLSCVDRVIKISAVIRNKILFIEQ